METDADTYGEYHRPALGITSNAFSNVYHDETVARESNPATAFSGPTDPCGSEHSQGEPDLQGFEPRLAPPGPSCSPRSGGAGWICHQIAIPPFMTSSYMSGSGAPDRHRGHQSTAPAAPRAYPVAVVYRADVRSSESSTFPGRRGPLDRSTDP